MGSSSSNYSRHWCFSKNLKRRNGTSRAPDQAVLIARRADPKTAFFTVIFPASIAIGAEDESMAAADLAGTGVRRR